MARKAACGSYIWIEFLKLEKGHTPDMVFLKVYADWALFNLMYRILSFISGQNIQQTTIWDYETKVKKPKNYEMKDKIYWTKPP